MPTYDYKCLKCGYSFEHFQKMSDELLKECPVCKGEIKRMIGAGLSPIFKGSGFYETDYKNNSNKKSSHKSTSVSTSDKVKPTKSVKETKTKKPV